MKIIYIISGAILSLSAGGFFSLILYDGIKMNKIKKVILSIVTALIIGYGFTTVIFLEDMSDVKTWNNGICSYCNTEYHLFDIEHIRNSGDRYYYMCENEHLIKLHRNFK